MTGNEIAIALILLAVGLSFTVTFIGWADAPEPPRKVENVEIQLCIDCKYCEGATSDPQCLHPWAEGPSVITGERTRVTCAYIRGQGLLADPRCFRFKPKAIERNLP